MDYKALASSVGNRDGYGTQEWVYHVLRTGIVNGTLPGGMQLKQDEISAALNVSHIPVREALRQPTIRRVSPPSTAARLLRAPKRRHSPLHGPYHNARDSPRR